MTVPYLDSALGLRDPDPLGDWTLTGFGQVCVLPAQRWSRRSSSELLPGLQCRLRADRQSARARWRGHDRAHGFPFIEALPGAHPILEDFKLFHRVLDVKKVQAEVRAAELENLRMAARLLAGEREDPTIEKKVVFQGAPSVAVTPDDA